MNKHPARLVFFAVLFSGLFASCAYVGIAHAAGVAPDPSADTAGFFGMLLGAVQGRQWWLLASTVVVGITWLIRLGIKRKSTSWLTWFTTDRGGVVLTAILSVLGGFATIAAAGHAPDFTFLLDCLKIMIGAIGQYVAVKRLVKPADLKPATGAP